MHQHRKKRYKSVDITRTIMNLANAEDRQKWDAAKPVQRSINLENQYILSEPLEEIQKQLRETLIVEKYGMNANATVIDLGGMTAAQHERLAKLVEELGED